MLFEWDEAKDRLNARKHGVSLSDAVRIFEEPTRTFFDVAHEGEEDRYIAIGYLNGRLMVVVFVERDGDFIRLISARKATRKEVMLYERGC